MSDEPKREKPALSIAQSPKQGRSLGQSWLPAQSGQQSWGAWSVSDTHQAPHTPQVPSSTRRYHKLSVIGEGGMGCVWLGWDGTLERNVAIKEPLGTMDSSEAKHLFYESKITAKLEHPGIVSIYDLFFEDDRPHFVMKLISGTPIGDTVPPTGCSNEANLTTMVRHLLQACEALGFAHQAGVMHRDISPKNILTTPEGVTYIIDWGLAVLSDDLPKRLGYVGTPGYIAPEQRVGDSAGRRSDVWSLGALLHFVLYGSSPNLDAPPRVPKHPELHAIVMCALAHEPKDRYADALEMARDLERWFEGRRVEAYELTPWRAAKRAVRLYKKQIFLAAGVLLMMFATLAVGLWRTDKEATRAKRAERIATVRQKEASAEALAAKKLASTLAYRRAQEQIKVHQYLGAKESLHSSLKLHDNPQARGMLLRLATQTHPVHQEDRALPECEGLWHLTSRDDLAVCAGHIQEKLTSFVKVWHQGEWTWSKEAVDERTSPLSFVKTWVVEGTKIHVVQEPRGAQHNNFGHTIFDALTGNMLSSSPVRGRLLSSRSPLRVSPDNTEVLGYPNSKGVCRKIRRVEFAVGKDREQLWILCDTFEMWLLRRGGRAERLNISPMNKPQHYFTAPDGKAWIVAAQGTMFALDDIAKSWEFGESLKRLVQVPRSPWVVLLGYSGKARMFNTKTQNWGFEFPEHYQQVRVSDDQSIHLLSHQDILSSWKFSYPSALGKYTQRAGLSAIHWVHNDTRIIGVDGSGFANLFEPDTGKAWPPKSLMVQVIKAVTTTPDTGEIWAAGINPDGPFRVEAEPTQMKSYPWKTERTLSRRLIGGPNGKLLSGPYGPAVDLIDTKNNTKEALPLPQNSMFHDMDRSLDARHLVLIFESEVIRWNWEYETHTLYQHKQEVTAGSISNKQEVVISTRHGDLLLFDAQGIPVHTWSSQSERIIHLEWIPNSRYVATGHVDGTLEIWDVDEKRLVAQDKAHTSRLSSISITNDAQTLASSGWDGAIVLWDLRQLDQPLDALLASQSP